MEGMRPAQGTERRYQVMAGHPLTCPPVDFEFARFGMPRPHHRQILGTFD